MPEGLSEQDRARIESARESTFGCLVGLLSFGLAVLITLGGIILMSFYGLDTRAVFVLAPVILICLVFGLAYRWPSKQ